MKSHECEGNHSDFKQRIVDELIQLRSIYDSSAFIPKESHNHEEKEAQLNNLINELQEMPIFDSDPFYIKRGEDEHRAWPIDWGGWTIWLHKDGFIDLRFKGHDRTMIQLEPIEKVKE